MQHAVDSLRVFFNRTDRLKKLEVARPIAGLSPEETQQVSKKLAEFSRYIEKAEQLDAEIIQLQQASRTSFKTFRKLHAYLCMRSRLYNQLHSLSYVSQLNYSVLVVVGSAMVVALAIVYNPGVKVNNTPVFVQYIKAAPEDQPAVVLGENDHIGVLFSDKENKVAGATIAAKSYGDSTFQLSTNLLADGLAIPVDKQVGDKLVSWYTSQQARHYGPIPVAHAQDAGTLPKTTVANVEVETPTDQSVIYTISDLIKMRYDFDEWKIKETITLKKREAILGNTIKFALNGDGLVFKADTDGSWQAFRTEDSHDLNRATAVFRLYAPTVHDHQGKRGDITMDIKDNVATYTIDQKYLDQAEFPLTIDPTISQSGRTCTWSNGAGTNVWATTNNWSCSSGFGPPASGDAVVFDSTSNTAVNAASDSVADDIYSVTFASGYTNTVTLAAHAIASNDTTPDNYKWDLETLTMNGGNLVLVGDPTVNPAVIPVGCSVSVKCGRGIEIAANTVSIASGASINANATGFSTFASKGPGGANQFSGASYGGTGAGSAVTTYGSITAPDSLGSASAHSTNGVAAGGGAVKLSVSGSLTNNGTISANGASGDTFAGSGGSVYITASTLSGSGAIKADGGAGTASNSGGGGSGGRVAIVVASSTYSGAMTAYGGDGRANATDWYDGAAGTVYSNIGAQVNGSLIVNNNNLIVDNGARSEQVGWGTKLPAGNYTFDTITLSKKGTLLLTTGSALDIRNTTITGDNSGGIKHFGGTLTTNTSLTITGWTFMAGTTSIGSVTDLTIGSGGALSHLPNYNAETYKLNLTLTNLTINSGGSVDVTGMGYGARLYNNGNLNGPGAPTASTTSGAGHGGAGGGPDGGVAYGSSTAPITIGSASETGAGGGAVKLTVTGNLVNNGSIISDSLTANNNPPQSNGAGGSIYVVANNLSGNGLIAARGGPGQNPQGGGGGGRIALYTTGTDTFSGTKSVAGGTSTSGASFNGSNGTIYTQHFPVVSINSPSSGATNQSQRTVVSFSATDADTDYWRAQIQVSTDNFATSCNFTQTSTASSFNAGTCSGAYASLAGAFSGMNSQSNTAYTSGTTANFTFTADLTQNQQYKIRVKAMDPAGGAGNLAIGNGGTADANGFDYVPTYGSTSFTVSPITKLVYSTTGADTTCTDLSSGQTVVVAQASSAYTVQVCNGLNEAVKVASSTTIALSSSSNAGSFSTTSNGTYTSTLNITIASGSSAQSFYYKDTTVGSPTLTADESPSAGWTAATQTQTLKSDVPVRLNMTLSGNPTTVRAGYNSAVTVTAYDQYNNVATDFTGSKTLVFGGANNATSVITGTTTPTVTNSSNTAVAFGTDTAINFTNGVSQSRTMVLKKVEPVVLTVQDSTGGVAGITNSTTTNSFTVIPGDLATFSATDYPQASTGQFASAGFPWSTTGSLAAGNQAPYDVTVTAFDGYGNVKYDYEGSLTFAMDNSNIYSVPPTYTFTWNQSHSDTAARTTTSSPYDNGKHIFNASDFTITSSGSAMNFYVDGDNAVRKTLVIKIKPADIGRIGISFSPPMATETVGTAFDSNVIVTAYDILGNVKTDYTGSVYFRTTDPAATVPYTATNKYTFTDEDLGVKTFDKTGFSFATGGNQAVTVIDADTNRECNPDPTNSNYANCYTDTSNLITVPVHPVTNFAAIAGHQSVTLSWRNPADPAVTKVSIYRSTTEGVLGTKLSTQPGVSPSVASQYTVNGLINGTTYYFTIKATHLDPSGTDAESAASPQIAATPADIAPRDVTASQGSDGRVAITYGLRFPSTVSISYYLPETDSWAAATAGAMSGDVGAGINGSDAIDAHTAYFTPTVDIPNKYYIPSVGFKVRIDVLAQNSSAQGVSNIILLDTTPPRVNTGESMFIMDATGNDKVKLTLMAREDGAVEQTIQYRLSNNADMSNATSYTTLTTKPTIINEWNLDGSDTVYAQFKDPYNNIASVNSKLLTVPTAFGIKDASNLDESKYRLVLTWTDPQIANFSQFLIDRSLDNSSWEQIDTTTKDGYINVGLEEGKKYYYRVKSKDIAGNISRPSIVLASQPGAAPDVTAKPTIEVQNWKQEYGVRATVKWTTDQLADSFVVYSKKPLKDGNATLTTDGEAAQVVGQFDKTLEHEVLVQQLEPSTKYYFKTLSQNDIKITGASEVVELTTPARIPLSLSGVKFVDTKPTSTTVVWTTNKLSTTVLEYGVSTEYGKTITDKNLNTDHTIPLADLQDGVTYHVRVNATDADGNTTSSDDYLVQTPATPSVSDVRVSELQANTATITWRSNVNSDSNVEFGTTTAYGSQQGKSDATTLHTVTIIGLEPATTYNYRARSADQFGNVATGQNLTFTTPKDTTAPEISNIKSEITVSGTGDTIKLKAIISWDTNEAATSQVEYGIGLSEEYPEKSPETVSFNQSHTIILPDLKANASYQYRIVAKDAAGNIAKGEPQTLITPPKNKSLLQLVIKSLEETFSWTKRLNESPLIKRFR